MPISPTQWRRKNPLNAGDVSPEIATLLKQVDCLLQWPSVTNVHSVQSSDWTRWDCQVQEVKGHVLREGTTSLKRTTGSVGTIIHEFTEEQRLFVSTVKERDVSLETVPTRKLTRNKKKKKSAEARKRRHGSRTWNQWTKVKASVGWQCNKGYLYEP